MSVAGLPPGAPRALAVLGSVAPEGLRAMAAVRRAKRAPPPEEPPERSSDGDEEPEDAADSLADLEGDDFSDEETGGGGRGRPARGSLTSPNTGTQRP